MPESVRGFQASSYPGSYSTSPQISPLAKGMSWTLDQFHGSADVILEIPLDGALARPDARRRCYDMEQCKQYVESCRIARLQCALWS